VTTCAAADGAVVECSAACSATGSARLLCRNRGGSLCELVRLGVSQIYSTRRLQLYKGL
jgi:hypothetical protein